MDVTGEKLYQLQQSSPGYCANASVRCLNIKNHHYGSSYSSKGGFLSLMKSSIQQTNIQAYNK